MNNKQLALDEAIRLYDRLYRRNRHLEDKAGTLLQSGSIVTALTTVSALISRPGGLSQTELGLLVIVLVLFSVMLNLAARSWLPSIPRTHPFTADWEELFQNYIHPDNVYDQHLSDYLNAISGAQSENDRLARNVQAAGWLQVGQIALLAILLFVL